MILKSDAPCCHGPLQEEPQGDFSLLCLDKGPYCLVTKLENLLAFLFPVFILKQ